MPAPGRKEPRAQKYGPGQCQSYKHYQIKIERRRMVILVSDKPRKVMLHDELIDEFPAMPPEHRPKPQGRFCNCERSAPHKTLNKLPIRRIAPQQVVNSEDSERDNDTDQTLGEKRSPDE